MDRYEKEFFMQLTTILAYMAVAGLVIAWLGPVVGLAFIAVTMTITALGFYGSILEDEKKKRDI